MTTYSITIVSEQKIKYRKSPGRSDVCGRDVKPSGPDILLWNAECGGDAVPRVPGRGDPERY